MTLPLDPHPLEAVVRFVGGVASPDDRRQVIAHLVRQCAVCRRQLAEAFAPAPDPMAVSAAVDRGRNGLGRLLGEQRETQPLAAALAEALPRLPEAERMARLASLSRSVLRALCQRLLVQGRRLRHESATATLAAAELAVDASARLEAQGEAGFAAPAWAELGNARRIAGDLAGAEAALVRAESHAERRGAEPSLFAEILSLRGSLANYRRRFDEAEQLLERAAQRFAAAGDARGVGEVLLKVAHVAATRGEPWRGLTCLRAALPLIGAELPQRAVAAVMLLYLVTEAGEPEAAWQLCHRLRPVLAGTESPLDRLRVRWLLARIERDRGRPSQAIVLFEDLRRDYLAAGLAYEAALVSLDLAAILAREGRREELAGWASACAEVFAGLGIDREHLASLALLAQMGAAEAAEQIAALTEAVHSIRRPAAGPAYG